MRCDASNTRHRAHRENAVGKRTVSNQHDTESDDRIGRWKPLPAQEVGRDGRNDHGLRFECDLRKSRQKLGAIEIERRLWTRQKYRLIEDKPAGAIGHDDGVIGRASPATLPAAGHPPGRTILRFM